MLYEQFVVAVKNIAELIQNDEFLPEVIVAIARDGWIPARLLSQHLGVKRLHSYGLTYADETRTDLITYDQPQPLLLGKKILLVEDFLESGKSMKFCRDRLSENGNTVKTTTVGYTGKSIIIPDYTLGLIDEVPKLPWD